MFTRKSTAVWRGDGATGQGTLDTQSGAFAAQPYSFKTRFQSEDGKAGTNPEELLGAAHAGCYAMALSFMLQRAGHVATELRVTANVKMEQADGKWSVTGVALELDANVPGVEGPKLQELAEEAKKGCPISRALAVPITLTVRASA